MGETAMGEAVEPLELDVREDLRAGREPFGRIQAAFGGLRPGQALVLYATFEPVPLIRLMAGRGYSADVRVLGDGDFAVRFEPQGA